MEDFVEDAEYSAASAEEQEQRSLEYNRISFEYGKDMLTAAEYAVQHNYYNWENCPEPSMKDVWEKLFKSENTFCSELEYKKSEDGGYVDMVIEDSGYKYHYHVFPDKNVVRYNGETVYFGGETV